MHGFFRCVPVKKCFLMRKEKFWTIFSEIGVFSKKNLIFGCGLLNRGRLATESEKKRNIH